jgi:hypothetical protein
MFAIDATAAFWGQETPRKQPMPGAHQPLLSGIDGDEAAQSAEQGRNLSQQQSGK